MTRMIRIEDTLIAKMKQIIYTTNNTDRTNLLYHI